MLPPFSLSAVLTQWQFAPIVTAVAAVAVGLYGWGVIRVFSSRSPPQPDGISTLGRLPPVNRGGDARGPRDGDAGRSAQLREQLADQLRVEVRGHFAHLPVRQAQHLAVGLIVSGAVPSLGVTLELHRHLVAVGDDIVRDNLELVHKPLR